ncbi:trans-resveratrol di-O-methyltransferase-like [Syzygium oleosum]|uniref:trans-resveratrol di-O-methyltransferase-like n=1 Tax=Syzygium oleosum TaxID=219896 RepID=UPI0024BB69E4|nr:trans-resveratrol di-O-methyltransferase-like [Syzygium oleosum]
MSMNLCQRLLHRTRNFFSLCYHNRVMPESWTPVHYRTMHHLSHSPEAKEMFQAQSHLYNHTFNFISSMSLKCAVQLQIPDVIHDHERPMTLLELASALRIHPSKSTCLYRLMRVLVHSGFFAETLVLKKGEEDEEEEIKAYVLTPSRLLLSDKVVGLSPFVVAMLDPALVTPWHFLGDWLQGNNDNDRRDKLINPFEAAHGVNLWDYGRKNPEFGNTFNRAMASDSQMMNLVIKDCKEIFEGLNSLVDVGGSTGIVARIISEACPGLKCTVLDLPHVVVGLPDSENVEFVGGDMFESIPSTDAVLLRWMLHAWSDENCVKVLRKCKEAIGDRNNEQAKVIIIDIVISETEDDAQEETATKLFFDVLMMTSVTGRERTEKEWEKLFLEAGFRQYKITPMFGLRSLIEVFP